MSLLGKTETVNGPDPMDGVIVGIPTFRRPLLLHKLLETVEMEVRGTRATVIVADNACTSETSEIVDSFSPRMHSLIYVPVPERGLAPVRNALIAAAMDSVPHWRWLAMLDDDGLATAGWLRRLIECGEQFSADLVGGPVEGILPAGAGRLARNSIFAGRRRWKTGLVPTLNTTQNLLISRRLIDHAGGTKPFSNDYSASGGEDYELFRRTARAGGRIAWCDEAVIFEPAPASRLRALNLLERYYTTGMYMSRIDRKYDGGPRTWWCALKGLIGAVVTILWNGLRGEANGCARGILSVSHYIGRIVGLLGGLATRYITNTGEPS